MNKAVARFHNDVKNLHNAEAHRAHDAGALRHNERALTHDKKALQHDKDAFAKDNKKLDDARTALGKAKTSEQNALAPLEAQQAALQQQYDATVDPTTGQGDPALAAQLAAATQAVADKKAQLDPTIAADQKKVDGLKAEVQQLRQAAHTERTRIASERSSIAKEKKAVKHDASVVQHDRQRARRDLKPAEFHMNLRDTNKARHEVGLKSVSEVIRPEVPNVVGGQVGKWIAEAQTILKQHGVPMSKMNAHDLAIIIEHESSGNPRAINLTDINAQEGHPSKGLMQTIPSTFAEYHVKGHNQIYNPVDNIMAGVRYAIARYGSISNVPGVRAVHAGGQYVGY